MTGGKQLIRRLIGLFMYILAIILLSACQSSGKSVSEQGQTKTRVQTEESRLPVTGAEEAASLEGRTAKETLLHFSSVLSQGPGWLVIHAQQDGQIGPVVGFTPLSDGENKDVIVPIDPAATTKVLYAVLHIDAGAIGTFEYPGADEEANYSGKRATTYHNLADDEQALGDADVRVLDQDIRGGEVRVDEVISPGFGWLVIYAKEGSDLGQPLGYVTVNEGSNRDIVVEVNPDQATGELYAILHTDAGKLRRFEYPGSDDLLKQGWTLVGSQFNATTQASDTTTSMTGTPDRAATGQTTTQVVQVGTPQQDQQAAERTSTAAQTEVVQATAAATEQEPADQALVVQDQKLENDRVIVERVSSSGTGWVVIYNQANNNLGEVIGYSPVKGGEEENIQVRVDPGKTTDTLYAILHLDAGTPGKAEFPNPDTAVTNGPQVVVASFRITKEAASTDGRSSGQAALVRVADQEITTGRVTIDEVVSQRPGWLVVYTEILDQPGEILGHAAVKAGQNRDITVQIDAQKATEDLFVVLHEDTGVAGTFEFPAEDEPVMQDQKIVQAIFRSTSGQTATGTPQPAATHVHPAPNATASTPGSTPETTGNIPAIQVEDQVIRGGVVKVPYAYSLVSGFMTIHNQNSAGAFGPIIGSTPIRRGENRDIFVKIDLLKATETLYAMLHEDVDPKGILEFPGPDKPIMVGDNVIVLPFKITSGMAGEVVNILTSQDEMPHLVDGSGMSLYISVNDTPGVSNCTGECQNLWFPVLVTGRLVVSPEMTSSKFGVVVLSDGRRQVTYAGLPLYYFSGDKQPGDTQGHGVDGVWFLAVP